MVVVSLDVEGMVCDEQQGRVNVYIVLYCVLQGSRVSPPWFLTLWGLENTRVLLRTPISAYIPTIAFLSSSWCLSWFVFAVELNRLPGKPEGEPCVHGTIEAPIDIQLIL
jgi:hypothetical protein